VISQFLTLTASSTTATAHCKQPLISQFAYCLRLIAFVFACAMAFTLCIQQIILYLAGEVLDPNSQWPYNT